MSKRKMMQEDESDVELTEEEIQAIHDKIDEEIAKNGYPTDEEIMAMIEELNKEA